MENHYENTTRIAHLQCPRCGGKGETAPVSGRTLTCGRCFGTGEDIVGTLTSLEADLVDLRSEWSRYNSMVLAAHGGKKIGLSRKLDGLSKRGKSLLAIVEALRVEVASHKAGAPF